MKATEVLDNLKRRFPNEPEYLQAVEEVLTTNIPNLKDITSSNAFAFPIASIHSAYHG